MHPALIQACLPEILRELSGRPVTKVELFGGHALRVRFGRSGGDLWVSAHPELSRVGLLREVPGIGEAVQAPDNLDEPLLGATLRGAEQEPGGRVARFLFRRGDGGRHAEPVLVAELIPRFANAILLGDGEKILWCRREFRGAGRPRQVGAGEVYRAPTRGSAGAAEKAPVDLDGAASPGEAVDAWYREREEADFASRLAAELRRVVTRRLRRADKALVRIRERLADADREPAIRRSAELLTAHLREVPRGQSRVTLPDFDGEGRVEIPLDPKLDAQGNAAALFKKARRLARSRDEVAAQLSVQEAERERAQRTMAALEAEPRGDALLELVRQAAPSLLSPGGGARAHQPVRTDRPERAPSLPEGFTPRRYELPGGWEVWVGRSAKQNDELTHRHAAQRDLWFHARGAQGSHTVLRVASGKGDPPRDVIEAAAAIAAWHSKARHSGLVPVAYTEKRYVRKPRKSPVGTAMMMREKVLMVRPSLPGG